MVKVLCSKTATINVMRTNDNIMIKTKFFLGSSCSKIQTEVNEYLTSEKVEYVDIKFGTGLGQMVCVLVYTETE